MLPAPTRQKLLDLVPASVTVSGTDPLTGADASATVDVNGPVWAGQNTGLDYPVVALSLGPVAVTDEDRQPLSDVIRREARDGDATLAYAEYVGAKVSDTLTVTIAVDSGEGSVPQADVAKGLAARVYAAFRFANDLNVQGGDYEWPILISPVTEGLVNTSGMTEETAIQRYQAQFQVRYTLTVERLVEAAATLEVDLTLTDAAGNSLTGYGDGGYGSGGYGEDAETVIIDL